MDAIFGEPQPDFCPDTTEVLALASEAPERQRAKIPPARHPLAAKLGRLLTNPRVTGDFFQTVWAVRLQVNTEIPSRQITDDARLLLNWFGQSRTHPTPAAVARSVETARPVLDAAAQELALRRSIEAARTYNMAQNYGSGVDAAAVAQFYPTQDQLIQ